jgi:TldD protein
LELQEFLRSLDFHTRYAVHGFIGTQSVSIAQRGGRNCNVAEVRRRWGFAIDLYLPQQNGGIRWIEHSRGGTERTLPHECRSILNDLRNEVEMTSDIGSPRPVSPGQFDIVFNPRCSALLFHEIAGHFFEEDTLTCARRVPALGQRLGSARVTVEDDATAPEMFGSRKIDDEGQASRRIPLITQGVLSGFLVRGEHPAMAHLTKVPCAVRQDFRFQPMGRVSNTVVSAGVGRAQDFLAELRHGILVNKLAEGKIEPDSGMCTLIVSESFLVEHGRTTVALQPFAIYGTGVSMLGAIQEIGVDSVSVASFCRSQGVIVPVGGRAPSCLVRSLSIRPLDDGDEELSR